MKTFEEEIEKHYNNLTKSALRLNEIVKEQQNEIEEYSKKEIEAINKFLYDKWDYYFEKHKARIIERQKQGLW